MYIYAFSNASEPFQINLTASCNFGCECDMNDVQPVCGANGLTYFSPCHAGCSGANNDNYTNCACKWFKIFFKDKEIALNSECPFLRFVGLHEPKKGQRSLKFHKEL